MPKKKDGMLFELLPRPTKGEDGQPLLYPRPAIGFKYNIQAFDDFCAKYRSASSGDVIRFFEMVLDVASWFMRDGSRIETPLGSFAPKLKLDGDNTDPKKVQSKNVQFAGIEFIPSKRFEMSVEDKIRYGYLRKEEVVERHPVTDTKELEKVLDRCLQQSGYTTVRYFSYYSDLKYRTAKRFLDNLCKGESPLLRRVKVGQTCHYRLIVKQKSKQLGIFPTVSIICHARVNNLTRTCQ